MFLYVRMEEVDAQINQVLGFYRVGKQKDPEAREAMLCDIGKANSEIVHCVSSWMRKGKQKEKKELSWDWMSR